MWVLVSFEAHIILRRLKIQLLEYLERLGNICEFVRKLVECFSEIKRFCFKTWFVWITYIVLHIKYVFQWDTVLLVTQYVDVHKNEVNICVLLFQHVLPVINRLRRWRRNISDTTNRIFSTQFHWICHSPQCCGLKSFLHLFILLLKYQ